jgi:hypothetical protein
MTGLLDFFQGKKSYLIAFAAAATGAAQAMGYTIPDWIYVLEASLFGFSVRAAITRSAP